MKQTNDENVNGEQSQTLTRIKHRIILGIALGDSRAAMERLVQFHEKPCNRSRYLNNNLSDVLSFL
jgi:hypothetical protein